MYYGDEKKKQMARSILPSTRSRWARFEQRRINKQNRQKVRQELHKALYDEDYREEGDFYAEPDWGWYVRERQEGDKLNHFMKWAEEITKDVPRDDRLAKIKAILPDNLIGWHAVSHLEFRDHFMTDAELDNQRWYYRDRKDPEIKANRRRQEEARQEREHRLLREIVEDNRIHRLLNQWMNRHHKTNEWHLGYTTKTRTIKDKMGIGDWVWTTQRKQQIPITELVGPEEPRLLGGLGDIEDFLRDLDEACRKPRVKVEPFLKRDIRNTRYYWRNKPPTVPTYVWESIQEYQVNPDRHPEWRRAMRAFLNLYEKAENLQDLTHKTRHSVLKGW